MERVLVISPHPDDEAIGCGGTLCKHAADGDQTRVIFLTSGEHGGHGRPPDETARRREQEAETAAAVLGIAHHEFWRLPDGRIQAAASIVDRLHRVLLDWRPAYIYVTHAGEMHADHRAAARLVRKALARRDTSLGTTIVREYEIWTPLATMDDIVDISEYVDQKRAAIQAHQTQCAVMKFCEAALSLNRYRGEYHSWPGGDYAEVFRRMRP